MKKLFAGVVEGKKKRRSLCPFCKKGLWIDDDGDIVCKKCGKPY